MTVAVNCARRNLSSSCISSTTTFFDCKSILQKTLKQFGQGTLKYERKSSYKSNFHCVSLRKRVCFCPLRCCPVMSRDMFLQSALQFGLLPSKPCLFHLNSFATVKNPNLLVWRLNYPPIYQFQFCITAGRELRSVLLCLFCFVLFFFFP